jgi:signal transduction histidine kinase
MISLRLLPALWLLTLSAPAAEPLRNFAALRALSHEAAAPGRPIEVEAVVLGSDPASPWNLFLHDGTAGCYVNLIPGAGTPQFSPGTRVEVDGFGGVAPFRPVVRAARVEELGQAASPAPVPFRGGRSDLPAMHAELVTLEAAFLARQEGRAEVILECQLDSQIFEALLPAGDRLAATLAPGDRLRLTGICELTTTHALPRIGWVDGFRLHLPGPSGVAVIARAPWWTPQRLLVALGLTSALAALGLGGAWMLRRQVNRQLGIIGDKLRAEAVSQERDRMARDLHDTLEQQLSGVALQLDGLDDAVKSNPPAARQALTLARRMLRYTRIEARRSVWDLRSQVLEKHGLTAALQAMADAAAAPAGPKITVQGSGPERRAPAAVEFHLFRIAQEAVTNALKHSGARQIAIEVTHTPDQTRLTVRDDGRGFDPDAKDLSPGPHFGLLGLRERAAKIGAELALAAAPGAGCAITVTAPTTPPAPNP